MNLLHTGDAQEPAHFSGASAAYLRALERAFTGTLKDAERLEVVGIPTYVRASAVQTGGAFSLFETHDGPNEGPPLHIHRHEAESMLVLEGSYLLQIGTERREAAPGTFAHFPIGVPHTYAHIGAGTGRLLVLATPGGYEQFFRQVDAAAREPGYGIERLAEIAARFGVEIIGPPLAAR